MKMMLKKILNSMNVLIIKISIQDTNGAKINSLVVINLLLVTVMKISVKLVVMSFSLIVKLL